MAEMYVTGKPCKYGHVAPRYVSNWCCSACKAEDDARRRAENPEGHLARARADYHKHKHSEKRRERNRAYRKANPEILAASKAKRRAHKMQCGGNYTAGQIKDLGARQKWRCVLCKVSVKSNYHIDHVVPLARGGSNFIHNIQILCPGCNTRKGSKDPIDFAQQMGMLL